MLWRVVVTVCGVRGLYHYYDSYVLTVKLVDCIPRIVGAVVRVDDKTVVQPHEAIRNLRRIRAAVLQRRQQLSVVHTSTPDSRISYTTG